MRKLIVSMNLTLDGYMSGAGKELDWHFRNWSPDMGQKLASELSKTDTILLGRSTYEEMAKFWSGRPMEMQCPRDDIALAVMMNRHHKVVCSKTLENSDPVLKLWNNSSLIRGNLKEEIHHLKRSGNGQAKNIITFGSGRLVHELILLELVDEYQLWVHPVILGKGQPLFKESKNKSALRLVHTREFSSGVIMLNYETI